MHGVIVCVMITPSTQQKETIMENPNNVYINNIEDEDADLSDDEILLDKFDDVEYNTPYDDDYSDVLNVGGVIEGGDIFADR